MIRSQSDWHKATLRINILLANLKVHQYNTTEQLIAGIISSENFFYLRLEICAYKDRSHAEPIIMYSFLDLPRKGVNKIIVIITDIYGAILGKKKLNTFWYVKDSFEPFPLFVQVNSDMQENIR